MSHVILLSKLGIIALVVFDTAFFVHCYETLKANKTGDNKTN